MQVWHFSEMAYHPGWETLADSIHRWIVRTLGEQILEWTDENS